MTVSISRRDEDIRKALLMMVEEVGEDYCFAKMFSVNEFAHILPTTWNELEEAGLVQPKHVYGNPQFQLTVDGWLEAVRLRGDLESPEVRRRAFAWFKPSRRSSMVEIRSSTVPPMSASSHQHWTCRRAGFSMH